MKSIIVITLKRLSSTENIFISFIEEKYNCSVYNFAKDDLMNPEKLKILDNCDIELLCFSPLFIVLTNDDDECTDDEIQSVYNLVRKFSSAPILWVTNEINVPCYFIATKLPCDIERFDSTLGYIGNAPIDCVDALAIGLRKPNLFHEFVASVSRLLNVIKI